MLYCVTVWSAHLAVNVRWADSRAVWNTHYTTSDQELSLDVTKDNKPSFYVMLP